MVTLYTSLLDALKQFLKAPRYIGTSNLPPRVLPLIKAYFPEAGVLDWHAVQEKKSLFYLDLLLIDLTAAAELTSGTADMLEAACVNLSPTGILALVALEKNKDYVTHCIHQVDVFNFKLYEIHPINLFVISKIVSPLLNMHQRADEEKMKTAASLETKELEKSEQSDHSEEAEKDEITEENEETEKENAENAEQAHAEETEKKEDIEEKEAIETDAHKEHENDCEGKEEREGSEETKEVEEAEGIEEIEGIEGIEEKEAPEEVQEKETEGEEVEVENAAREESETAEEDNDDDPENAHEDAHKESTIHETHDAHAKHAEHAGHAEHVENAAHTLDHDVLHEKIIQNHDALETCAAHLDRCKQSCAEIFSALYGKSSGTIINTSKMAELNAAHDKHMTMLKTYQALIAQHEGFLNHYVSLSENSKDPFIQQQQRFFATHANRIQTHTEFSQQITALSRISPP